MKSLSKYLNAGSYIVTVICAVIACGEQIILFLRFVHLDWYLVGIYPMMGLLIGYLLKEYFEIRRVEKHSAQVFIPYIICVIIPVGIIQSSDLTFLIAYFLIFGVTMFSGMLKIFY